MGSRKEMHRITSSVVTEATCKCKTRGVRSLGREDSLEEEMTTHSSTLAWKSPWTEEPGL